MLTANLPTWMIRSLRKATPNTCLKLQLLRSNKTRMLVVIVETRSCAQSPIALCTNPKAATVFISPMRAGVVSVVFVRPLRRLLQLAANHR